MAYSLHFRDKFYLMRSIYSFLFLTFLLSASSSKLLAQFWPPLSAGSTLTYKVNFKESQYDFIVKIKDIGEAVLFDYQMTNAQKTSGSIAIPGSAMENAVKQMNYFSGGYKLLTDETTVFFSRQSFIDVASGNTVTLSVGEDEFISVRRYREGTKGDNADRAYAEGENPPGTTYTLNGEESTAGHMLFYNDETGEHAYTVAMDKKFPLITYMNLGWTIELVAMTIPEPTYVPSPKDH